MKPLLPASVTTHFRRAPLPRPHLLSAVLANRCRLATAHPRTTHRHPTRRFTRQNKQYGYRNEAWIGVDDARAEVAYLLKNPGETDVSDLTKALADAKAALANYVSLAPAADIEAARTMASQSR